MKHLYFKIVQVYIVTNKISLTESKWIIWTTLNAVINITNFTTVIARTTALIASNTNLINIAICSVSLITSWSASACLIWIVHQKVRISWCLPTSSTNSRLTWIAILARVYTRKLRVKSVICKNITLVRQILIPISPNLKSILLLVIDCIFDSFEGNCDIAVVRWNASENILDGDGGCLGMNSAAVWEDSYTCCHTTNS